MKLKIAGILFFAMISVFGFSQVNENRQQSYEEEIIRYLGYEEIPVRYITLPYDVTMNHNVSRSFMDIGFILLMFVPLVFLWCTKSRLWRWILGVLLVLMTVFSIGTSHVINDEAAKVYAGTEELDDYKAEFSGSALKKMSMEVYGFMADVYQPIGGFFEMLTGNGDQITYLILIGIIYLLYFVYHKNNSRSDNDYLLGTLLLVYTFFILVLSAGIIWYGFLLFPLLYLELSRYIERSKTYRYMLYGAGGLFVLMAYFLKISGLYFLSDSGVGVVAPPVLEYNFADVPKDEVYEGYYKNISGALDQINSESESLIYQAGTALSFFIKNNNERVFKDGILNIHNRLVKKYQRKSVVNKALKASGFKYLIISPNLLVLDQTPEKTLTRKFQAMLGYLSQNNGLKLLATDRIVQVADENGQLTNTYGMFASEGGQIIYSGSYAIYEIL